MEEEEFTYQVNKNALEAMYPNQFAVIYSEEILGIKSTQQEAQELGESILNNRPFLVKHIISTNKSEL